VGGGPGDDVVAEDADALDLGLDAVAGLEVELERVRLDRGHARDRPGGEDVPGRVALGRVVRDPELRKRGLRVLPGGDYGFPNNPIGRNARDLELFVRLFGYSPAEALRAATQFGGQLMDMPVGLLAPEYLADVLVVRGEPAADVSVLQDPGNLLAIMQDGVFRKLAPELTVKAGA